MSQNRTKLGPGVWVRAAALLLTAALATGPPAAAAVPSFMGGELYYTGGDVTVDVLHSSTAYTDLLQLRTALADLDIAYNYEAGSRVRLTEDQLASWGISVGDELLFGIHVLETGHFFYLGPGSRNADGLSHSYLKDHGRGTYYVGVEDLYGGGDADYNDTMYRFSGGVARDAYVGGTAPAAQPVGVAEPSAVFLLVTGAGLLGWASRRS